MMLGRPEGLVLAVLYLGCSILVWGEQDAGYRGKPDYKGRYTIFEVQPKSNHDVDFLQKLMLSQAELDFWVEPRRTEDAVTFTAPVELRTEVRQKLEAANLAYKEEDDIRDVEEELQPVFESQVRRNFQDTTFNLDRFNNLEAINAYLRDLSSRCPSDINCRLYSIGKSFEGRDIFVFKISKRKTGRRKGFWIDATIHAREWLTTATSLKILTHLVNRTDPTAKRLVDSYNWFVAPVLNPDGYAFTFSKRLWRKNRHAAEDGGNCVGVDLNRNFDFRWGTEGVSHNACSTTYCGSQGASEPEVVAIQREARRLGRSLIGWVTLHSYGRMWVFPYGGTLNHDGKTCLRTDDYDDLMEVAEAAANAVERTYDTYWVRGTTCEVVYANSGSSLGYVKDVAGVKYSYGLELRGDGFIVDASEIQPSFVEVWNGLVAMCDTIDYQQQQQRNRAPPRARGRLDRGAIIASLLLRLFGRGKDTDEE